MLIVALPVLQIAVAVGVSTGINGATTDTYTVVAAIAPAGEM